MARIVLALGGNALGNTPSEQLQLIKNTAAVVAELVQRGDEVILTHGNGPQVGMIEKAMSFSAKMGETAAAMPFPECGAMSQGYIGFHLQQGISNEFKKRGIERSVVPVVTRVLVSAEDPAFKNPAKPIGAFMSETEAKAMAEATGCAVKEDAGRGWRRVVASPKPIDILEKDAVTALCDRGFLVVASGGGGVPVIEEKGEYKGVDAVIDKDLAAALLCSLVGADTLLILTAVPRVCINFGKPDETALAAMSVAEGERYIAEGQFAPGSMLPKVQAALEFAKKGGTAVIASLGEAAAAAELRAGTVIRL